MGLSFGAEGPKVGSPELTSPLPDLPGDPRRPLGSADGHGAGLGGQGKGETPGRVNGYCGGGERFCPDVVVVGILRNGSGLHPECFHGIYPYWFRPPSDDRVSGRPPGLTLGDPSKGAGRAFGP